MDAKNTKIVYMGTPEFAADILSSLIGARYNIVGVITETDKPQGRGNKIKSTPVKQIAQAKNIPVFQPDKKDEILPVIKDLKPDILVVAAYGKILPKDVLEYPEYGSLNIHPSFLPEYRGPSPIQYAILDGLEKTGITIMKMDEGMDTGDIIAQKEVKIEKDETASSLFEKTSQMSSEFILDVLPKYIAGELDLIKQDNDKAKYTKIIKKEDGHIDFSKKSEDEERKIRAYDIWPGAFAFWDDKRIKFLEVNEVCEMENRKPGEVFINNKKEPCVAFKNGCWIIKKLQLEGKSEMTGKDFLNGYFDMVGSILE